MAYRLAVFTLALFTQVAFGALEQSTARVAPWLDNMVKNPSCAKSIADIGGDAIVTRNASGIDNGTSCTVDASTAGEIVQIALEDLSLTVRYSGNGNCEAHALLDAADDASLYKFYVANNAGSTISTEDTPISGARKTRVTFACSDADSGSTFRIEALDNAAAAFDYAAAYVGQNLNQGTVAQAEVVVRAFRDSSAQAIGTTAATKIQWNAETFDAYNEFDSTTNYRFTAKRAGKYKFGCTVQVGSATSNDPLLVYLYKNGADVSNTRITYAGSTQGIQCPKDDIDLAIGDYVEVFISTGTDAAYNVNNGTTLTNLNITYFPDSSRQVVTPDLADLSGTAKIAGATSCAQGVTAASMTAFNLDTDCSTPTVSGNATAAGTKIFGFVVPTLKAGKYLVLASGGVSATQSTSGQQNCSYEIYDGTSSGGAVSVREGQSVGLAGVGVIAGTFSYTGLQTNTTFQMRARRETGNGTCEMRVDTADLVFTIVPLNQNTPAPLLTDSVTTTGGSTLSVNVGKIDCDATPSIVYEYGDWLEAPTQTATGRCTINFKTGVFSEIPTCTFTTESSGAVDLGVYRDTNITESTTAYGFFITNGGSATNADVEVQCIGPR